MTRLTELPVQDLICLVTRSYNSIDIRSVVGKKGNEWTNVFTKLRLTRESVRELQEVYQNKIQLFEREVRKDNFAILLYPMEISALDNLLDQIKKGYVMVGAEKVNLLATDYQTIDTRNIDASSEYWTRDQADGFKHVSVYSTIPEFPRRTLKKLNLFDRDIGVNFEEIAAWLDISSLENTTAHLCIVFPIYCKRLDMTPSDYSLATYHTHEQLVGKMDVEFACYNKDSQLVMKRKVQPSIFLEFGGDMVTITIPNPIEGLKGDEHLNVDLKLGDLGLLDTLRVNAHELVEKKPKEPDDALLPAFRFFKASIKIKEFLFSNGVKREREVATSWLISLLGFRPLFVAFNEECEKIMDRKVEKESADVLAGDTQSDRILLIDNIVTTPKDKTIQDMKNAAERIAGQIGKKVIPVIFSGEKCDVLKKGIQGEPVCIIDSKDVEEIMEAIENNDVKAAKGVFLSLLSKAW
jgi:hypothetical protein